MLSHISDRINWRLTVQLTKSFLNTMDFHSLIAVAALLVGIPTCVLMGKRRWLLVSGVTTVLSALAEIVAPDAFLRHEVS